MRKMFSQKQIEEMISEAISNYIPSLRIIGHGEFTGDNSGEKSITISKSNIKSFYKRVFYLSIVDSNEETFFNGYIRGSEYALGGNTLNDFTNIVVYTTDTEMIIELSSLLEDVGYLWELSVLA